MNIGILLALGDSFEGMAKTGQDVQFKNIYLKSYSQNFEKVFIFSYAKENPIGLPKNVYVLPNKYQIHRYLYAFLIPFLYYSRIKEISVNRAYHLSGTIPAVIIRILFGKLFVFNYAFDYKKFASIEKKHFQYLLLYLIEPIAFLFSKKIFVANKKYLYKSSKTLFLPNGVDTRLFHPKKNNIQKKVCKILTVGRLEYQKNHLMLLHSLKGLITELAIVGNGSLKDTLINEAQAIKVNLNIMKRVPYNNLPEIYRSSDIFILPSLIEGHPKVLLEAMSSGLPVICTNVEGSKEIIINNKNGLLTKINSQSIRKRVRELMVSHTLREKLSLAARRTVTKNFNLSKLLKIEIETIKNLI